MQIKTAFAPLEIKALNDDGTFEGYASVFDNIDSYGDVVKRGAFTKSINMKAPDDIAMLWQHNAAEVIGSWKLFEEDEHGLRASGQLITETQRGAEAYALLKAGAIKGLSIGFVARDTENVAKTREIREADLWEVSLVTFPANTAANVVSVRSAIEAGKTITKRDMERALSELGLSRREAMRFMSDGFEGLVSARDAGNEDVDDVRDAEVERDTRAAVAALIETLKT